MRFEKLSVCGFLSILVLFAAEAWPTGSTPVSRNSTTVFLWGSNAHSDLSDVLVGNGIEGVPPRDESTTTSGGTITWIKYRDQTDRKGERHVFYRQHYTPTSELAAGNSPVAQSGVWLVGAELGVHYNFDGELIVAFGTQFEDVVATSEPHVGEADEAFYVAQERVQDWPGFIPSGLEDWSPSDIESYISSTRLLLHSDDDNRIFRYVWEIPTRNSSGTGYVATLDAETGLLTSLGSTITWSECSPNSPDQDGAFGYAQNQAITAPYTYLRNIWATETDDRGPSYTHEAQKVSSGSNPDIHVFEGTDLDGCDTTGGDQYYSLIPVETPGWWPVYDNTDAGRSAADALYFTYKTMATLDDYGRDGWDDQGSDAVVVVESDCDGNFDNALMVYDFPTPPEWAPTPSVATCQRDLQPFTSAAAIDIVAHEWGHGVVFTSADWDRSPNPNGTASDGMIFHEGFADIIGHAVEWDNQPSGDDYEKADWELGEDRGAAWRQAYPDDGIGNESFHEDDPVGSLYSPHQAGNRLAVAQYLMSQGGENPVCARLPALDGCDVDVNGLGVDKASRILFEVLTVYATSSAGWEHFGNLAKWAAFSLYNRCPRGNASGEQQAAIDAFTAIGYPPMSSQPIPCW